MIPGVFYKSFWPVLLAAICAAGTWTYASRVLIPYQKADAAAHDRPRGNLSDLYPRWVGARELFLHGHDPYSPEVTREIQTGYYGRPIDPSRPNDPRDEQGFAYPLYVVFWLAPTIRWPFAVVQRSFFWAMLILTSASALIWIRVLRWALSWCIQASVLALTLGSLAVMQGLKLQQISLLVAGLLAIAIVLLTADHAVAAGVLLAAASVKPQLVLLLLIWLAVWTLADWRHRYRLAVSYLAMMVILIVAAELYLPHWIPRFWHAVREYRRYTGTVSVISLLIGGFWGRALELLACTAFLAACWRERRQGANSSAFVFMVSLALATTIVVAPTYGPYNQVFLIPALLLLVKDRQAIWQRSVGNRVLLAFAAMFLFWPWISSTALAGLSFILPQATVVRAWAVPIWTLTDIPVGVAGLMLVHYYQTTFTAPAGPVAS
jgi:Glycosyltransferase family 87